MEWEELAARRGTRFSSRPAYAWTWFETLGKGELALATLHRDGRLVALLPLHSRRRLGITVHRLLGHGLGTIGEALAADAEALKDLVAGLRQQGVLLELTHVPEDSPLLAELLVGDGWMVDYQRDETCPVMMLPEGSTAQDLRSKKTLKRLRVSRDAISRDHGPVEFGVIRTPAGLAACWPEIIAVTKAAREADEENKLNLLAGEYSEFGRRFLGEEAESGNLLLLLLRVDRKLVAVEVQLRTGQREEAWYIRYDPAFAKLAPGHQLLEFLADNHDELGVYESDQMIGTSSYKMDWQNATYEVGTVCASPREHSWQLPLARGIRFASAGAHQQYREIQPKLATLTGKLR
ncbi:GNAT family N-acetyltransferase [Corynebacterium occultum]